MNKQMVKTKIILTSIITFLFLCGWSQEIGERLERESDGLEGALGDLFGTDNSIKEVTLNSSSEKHLSVTLQLEGYNDKDYKLAAAILNRFKKPIKEIESITTQIPKKAKNMDLAFEFNQKSSGGYKSPYLESRYLSIVICEADDSLCDLDFGSLNILGESYTYKLKKKWRVSGGTSSMIVKVQLTPYKSAKTIKQ